MTESMNQPNAADQDVAAIERLRDGYQQICRQLGRVIVGQEQVVEQLLIALFANGHCLLEGVPGLAKTLMISTLARCLSLKFSRIQFTPDLMPLRHHRHRGHPRGSDLRRSPVAIFARAGLCQHRFGRRDQPHAA